MNTAESEVHMAHSVVIPILPNDMLNTFEAMWYQVFLWSLFSSILVHFVAATIAFLRLRKHKIGRFVPVVILVMGFITPLTGGVITSAAIAGIWRAADFSMSSYYALVCGVGQTIFCIVISFSRILATL